MAFDFAKLNEPETPPELLPSLRRYEQPVNIEFTDYATPVERISNSIISPREDVPKAKQTALSIGTPNKQVYKPPQMSANWSQMKKACWIRYFFVFQALSIFLHLIFMGFAWSFLSKIGNDAGTRSALLICFITLNVLMILPAGAGLVFVVKGSKIWFAIFIIYSVLRWILGVGFLIWVINFNRAESEDNAGSGTFMFWTALFSDLILLKALVMDLKIFKNIEINFFMLPNYGAARRFNNVPKGKNSHFIFPINPFTYTFEFDGFRSENTGNVVQSDDVLEVLGGVEKIIKHYKTHLQKRATFKWYCISVGFITLGALVNAVIFPLTQLIAFLFVGMSLLFIGVVMFFVATHKYSKYQQRMLHLVKKNANRYINKKKERFDDRGYRWVLPMDFPKWLELWKATEMTQEAIKAMEELTHPKYSSTKKDKVDEEYAREFERLDLDSPTRPTAVKNNNMSTTNINMNTSQNTMMNNSSMMNQDSEDFLNYSPNARQPMH